MRVIWTIYQAFIVTQVLFKIIALCTVIKFEGMHFLSYNKMSPPFELRPNLYGVQNPSIKKWAKGKLSSIFVSEIIDTSTLLLTFLKVTEICFE